MQNDSLLRRKSAQNVTIYIQERQCNIRLQPTDIPVDRITAWAHHHAGHAAHMAAEHG